jgi:hypothetical protein
MSLYAILAVAIGGATRAWLSLSLLRWSPLTRLFLLLLFAALFLAVYALFARIGSF